MIKMHAELSSAGSTLTSFGSLVQVEWPEQAASQQHPGLWDPLAAQARPAGKHSEMPHEAASAPTYDQFYLTLGLSAAGALAVAVAAAWLYVGS